jgi:hypothetical protein
MSGGEAGESGLPPDLQCPLLAAETSSARPTAGRELGSPRPAQRSLANHRCPDTGRS